MFCRFKRTETNDCIEASKYTDLATSYWMAKFGALWGDLRGTINIILPPHTLFLALTGRKSLRYFTWLVKLMSETPGLMCLFLCKYTLSPKEGTTALLSTKHLVMLLALPLIHQPHNQEKSEINTVLRRLKKAFFIFPGSSLLSPTVWWKEMLWETWRPLMQEADVWHLKSLCQQLNLNRKTLHQAQQLHSSQ